MAERFECYRCHDAPGRWRPAHRDRHCVACHQAVLDGAFDDSDRYPAEAVARWKKHVRSLTVAPSLVGVGRRFRREWLVRFLRQPHDLRPHLAASMPRLAMTQAEAEAIARHLVPNPPGEGPSGTPGDPQRGRALFGTRGCADCHTFSGALPDRTKPRQTRTPSGQLAPDLRHTRERMTAAALRDWLADPKKLKPDTLMPRTELTAAERRDLAAFILRASLAPLPSREPPVRRPLLTREVRYEEVSRKVFRKVCWHCHSDPARARGDGGPGNTGGFGFPGKRIDLSSYEAIRRGGTDAGGGRIDLLAPDRSGVPRVVRHMLARHAEVSGRPIAGVRGMPLGLPPMKLELIQLVDSWIAQGARR